jgi:hypothetical protein
MLSKKAEQKIGLCKFFIIFVPNLSAHYFYIQAKNGELISLVNKWDTAFVILILSKSS